VLESISGGKASVTAGAARMELPLKMLRAATKTESKKERNAWKARAQSSVEVKISPPPPAIGVPSSIMVRGMTLDEAMPLVERYLDRAYRAGYGEVTVIHGRGEGILRREVHSLCKNLPYIGSFRLGGEGEGGFGVTIVNFRK
jgi:DNA mismatch repair protein MutS2